MSDNKHDQILSAAKDCFIRYGYKKTTLDDIGKKVGLNQASLYHYFKNKEEIYVSIVLTEFKSLITNLYDEIKESKDCKQKILLYFEKRHEWWFEKSSILPQITEDELHSFMTIGKEIHDKIMQEEKENFQNLLKNCIEKKELIQFDVEKITRYIFSLVDGIRENYRKEDSIQPIEKGMSDQIDEDIQSALSIFLEGLMRVKV